jgi:hypothetical protein
VGEAEAVHGDGLEGAVLDAAVAAVTGAVQDRDAVPGQALAAGQQGGLVGRDLEQVVGVLVGDQEPRRPAGGDRRCAGSLRSCSLLSVAVLRNRNMREATSRGSSEIGTWLRPGSHCSWAWRTKARNRGLCMLTNGSAVPCRSRTGQVMCSSRVGTSNMAAWTVP